MAEITVERRNSSTTSPSRSPKKVEFEHHSRISFHVDSIKGLPSNQASWQPTPSIFVSVVSLEGNETFSTDPKKYNNVVSWGENMPLLEIRNTSKVRFELRSQTLWKNKTPLGITDTFQIVDLLEMQNRVGDDRDKFVELDIPLKSSKAVLTFSIHETAMPDQNTFITAVNRQRFMENCQRQSVDELRNFVTKIVRFRKMLNVDDLQVICIIDIILGITEGVYEILIHPLAEYVNKNTVEIFYVLNHAFTPYENLSSRHLSKKNAEFVAFLYEMLQASVLAFENVINFLRTPNRYVGDKIEFKIANWIRYFEECTSFLLVKEADRPSLPSPNNKRTKCPTHLATNPTLPFTAIKPLTMDLPISCPSAPYERSDLLKLMAEWMFSPPSFQERENQKILSAKGKGSLPTERNPVSPLTREKERKNGNLFCLSGPPGCGKTQLVSRAIRWFGEMQCLGGYFSFDKNQTATDVSVSEDDKQKKESQKKETMPSQNLNTLSVTLAHQLSVVEPGMVDVLSTALSNVPGSVLKYGTMEQCFETLFVNPLNIFDNQRVQRRWNIPEPLLFVIDGIGSGEEANSETISELAKLLSSNSIANLPRYVKLLVVCRSGSGLGDLLKENDVGYVYDMGAVGSSAAGSSCSGSSGRTSNPKFSIQAF